jgi:GNAT superfamily N-acetyltransferase
MTVRVRPATKADRRFIVSVVPRLRAFGDPPLRPAAALDRAERRALERALAVPSRDTTLLVAELDDTGPAGVAYAETSIDYFTGERHGHLAILAVAASGEGQGVGRALLSAVETWATERGYRFITLNVFDGNKRARAVYERAGYWPDTIRYAKELKRRTPRAAARKRGGAR